MHREALEILRLVLERFGIEKPILFGHSDGASIALIYAGSRLGLVGGLVLEAPHAFVEPVCVERIGEITTEPTGSELKRRLARHDGTNTEALFRSWTDVWLSEEFRSWDLDGYLPAISCQALVVQGAEDEYGTLRQVEVIAARVCGRVEALVLEDCGHAPHAERPGEVLGAVAGFVNRLGG